MSKTLANMVPHLSGDRNFSENIIISSVLITFYFMFGGDVEKNLLVKLFDIQRQNEYDLALLLQRASWILAVPLELQCS